MAEIKKETFIGEAVAQHPGVAQVLMGYGLHCVGCHVNQFESIEEGAKGHGMDDKTINKMVNDVNKIIGPTEEKFAITDDAAKKIKEILKKTDAKYLRVKVIPGGCSGFQYDFSESNEKLETDTIVEHDGATVLIDKDSIEQLKGSVINYTEDFKGSGFKIENPNATESCGCGSSFN